MNCRITDLRAKEVICVKDGSRLGNVCDVEIDTCTGQLCAIIVFGRARWCGIGLSASSALRRNPAGEKKAILTAFLTR